VRDIEDYQLGDALRMEQRRAPGDGSAPIVTYQEDFLLAELISNGDDIRDEFRECVRSDASGLLLRL